jgi:hypothetical protein
VLSSSGRCRFAVPSGAIYLFLAVDGETEARRLAFRLIDEAVIGSALRRAVLLVAVEFAAPVLCARPTMTSADAPRVAAAVRRQRSRSLFVAGNSC